jgi:transcriptional regulator with PAS, ATPase and Fis domain
LANDANTAESLALLSRETFPPERDTGVRPIPPALLNTRRLHECHLAKAHRFGEAVAVSRAMLDVFNALARVASAQVSVTLLGETGTGKDLLARAVHRSSPRASKPFVVFDCGAVPAALAESELLGHERGSFTGAIAGYAGAFERAHGGTLFLDEIGELPLELQPRLLRALENRKIRRVGGASERPCDVRVVCATNRDLRNEVAEGRFREDLYYRLATAVVVVPALRDRREDLDVLVPHLLNFIRRPTVEVLEATMARLREWSWPGNVRELKNALACAVAMMGDDAVDLEPGHLRLTSLPRTEVDPDGLQLGGQPLAKIERSAILQTLALHRGSKVHAARALGIAVSTLYEKVKRHGIAS